MSLSSVKAYRSMLSSVFQFKLPALGEDRVLHDPVRSFAIERPHRPQAPPSWDLDAVLRHLMSSEFEPLESVSLRALTKKTLFLVSLSLLRQLSGLVRSRPCRRQWLRLAMIWWCLFSLISLPRRSVLMLLCLAAFVCFRCESLQGTWRKAPSCLLCGLSTSICG